MGAADEPLLFELGKVAAHARSRSAEPRDQYVKGEASLLAQLSQNLIRSILCFHRWQVSLELNLRAYRQV